LSADSAPTAEWTCEGVSLWNSSLKVPVLASTRKKEGLRTLWTFRQGAAVRRFFDQWYAWASRSRLEPVKKVARTIQRHLDGVLRFAKHPITNGVAEGLNSKIMSIKRKAGGFRNPQNFTTAIYFHCGGLDLYPRESRKRQIFRRALATGNCGGSSARGRPDCSRRTTRRITLPGD